MNTKIKGGLKMEIAKKSFIPYVGRAAKDGWMLVLWGCFLFQLILNIISFVGTRQLDGEIVSTSIALFIAIIIVILFSAYVDYKNSIQRICSCYNVAFYLKCMEKVNDDTIRVNAVNRCFFPIAETLSLLKELQSLHLFVYEYPYGYCFQKDFYPQFALSSIIIDDLVNIELIQEHHKDGKVYYSISSRNDFDFFITAFEKTAS